MFYIPRSCKIAGALLLVLLFCVMLIKQRNLHLYPVQNYFPINKQALPLPRTGGHDTPGLSDGNSETTNSTESTRTKQHIVFIKVHKAASTTMHNILTRFALSNNLNIMLNSQKQHINELGYRINKDTLVPKPCGSTFDILCNHLIYNHSEISQYFPNDTVYIGIVREPFSQFLSAFVYYSYIYPNVVNRKVIEANPENPIEEFLYKTDVYLKGNPPNYIFLDNRMSVDFGFPLHNFQQSKSNESIISDFIKSLDKTIDFVLIVEYFDESLILLRRIMNWSTKDIIYIQNNVQKPNDNWLPFVNRKKYPPFVKSKFQNFARLDIRVYKHFLELFHRKLQEQPPDFQYEVDAFRIIRKNVTELCSVLLAGENQAKEVTVPGTEFTTRFSLSMRDCVLLTDSEIKITNKAKAEQLNRANDHTCSLQ